MDYNTYKEMQTENLIHFYDEHKFYIRSLQRSIDTIESYIRDYKIRIIKCDTSLSSVLKFYEETVEMYEERIAFIIYNKHRLEIENEKIKGVLSERNIIVEYEE